MTVALTSIHHPSGKLADQMGDKPTQVMGDGIQVFANPESTCCVTHNPTPQHRKTFPGLQQGMIFLIDGGLIGIGTIGFTDGAPALDHLNIAPLPRENRFADVVAGQGLPGCR